MTKYPGMTAFELDVDQVSRVVVALDLPPDNGLLYDDGTLYAPADLATRIAMLNPNDDGPRLTWVKAQLKRAVDDAAEAERLKYITGGAGQAMTYQRKVDQARTASAEQSPNPANYPLLAASIGIDGPDIAAVAAVVMQMDTAWELIGAGIEAARLGAKAAIDAATTEATARAVSPVWPQP